MTNKFILSFLAVCFLAFGQKAIGAENKSDAAAELKALVSKIQAKLAEDKKTEKDLAPELKEFDALIAKHHGEKTDAVAQIVFMKALLYVQVFENTEKGVEMLKGLKNDFPGTKAAENAEPVIIKSSLVSGAKFPDFEEKDVAGKPLSIANHKGKVVLIDFWATWCGPCVQELPNVLKAYDKYHSKGFEIIGISLDQKEDALKNFTATKKMAWQQYFDGKGWGNKLAVRYGVNSIPATYLLDGEGKIIGKDLRGDALAEAVAKALPKN